MSDISITVTADPQQALQGLEQIRKEADKLAGSQRKVQEASDAAATDAMNSVSSVSREVAASIAQTGDALSAVSGGIRMATNEAGKVAGAFGKSIPVIGQLGSAIAQAITGPVGMVSAAVGAAIAGITKMIRDVEERLELIRTRAAGKTSAAYDTLMQGRRDYADQLAVLAQVREINRYAEQNGLTADQLAQFRQLAGQIGIADKDILRNGIKTGKLGEAAKSIRQQREFYAEQEYQDYVRSFGASLFDSIMSSGLSDSDKNRLGGMTTEERVKKIMLAARTGNGGTLEEYRAWQELAGQVNRYNEVTASYSRDKLLGRDRSVLNDVIADTFRGAADEAAKGGAGSSGPAPVGSWAWQQEQDKIAQKQLDQEQKRADRVDRLIESMDRQIRYNELIADGKEKEAFLLKNRLQVEDANGEKLTEAQIAEIDARSERLYALQHPESPELAPEEPIVAETAAGRTRGAARQQYARRLDRLQAIGANLRNPAATPEKLVMDKQLAVQENIWNLLRQSASQTWRDTAMRF